MSDHSGIDSCRQTTAAGFKNNNNLMAHSTYLY